KEGRGNAATGEYALSVSLVVNPFSLAPHVPERRRHLAFGLVLQDRQMRMPAARDIEGESAVGNFAVGEGETNLVAFLGKLEFDFRGHALFAAEREGQAMRRFIGQKHIARGMSGLVHLPHLLRRLGLVRRKRRMLEFHLKALTRAG